MKRYRTATYVSWENMIERCTNPKSDRWKFYGAKGVKVCERWRSFDLFVQDMGERPSGKTLDRIDGLKGYEPDNCRWATKQEQMANISTNRNLTFNGQRLCVSEWERRLGFKNGTIKARLRYGWSVEKALTEPTAYRGQDKRCRL